MEKSSYRSRAWYPALVVGLSMSSFILIKTGRDAIFFQQSGLLQLPLVYIWIALGSLPAAMMHLSAINRWGSRQTRTGLFFFAALIFLSFVPFVNADQRITITLMFVLVPTLFAAIFAGGWLLAGDLLEDAGDADKHWAYSWIGATSMAGGIFGGLLAKGISLTFEPRYLMALGALLLVLTGLIVSYIHRIYPIKETDAAAPQTDPLESTSKLDTSPTMSSLIKENASLLKQPYIRTLLGISGLGALAGLYIDFQFYASTVIAGKNNTQFFADFYIVLNAASLLLQLTLAPRLQTRFGVGGALLLLPSVLLGGIGMGYFWTTIQSRAILRVTEGVLKAAIHRSTWEQTFLPIDRKKRDMVKVLVDGLFARLTEGVGAAVLLIWLTRSGLAQEELDLSWISWAIAAAIILWIGLARYLGKIGCSNIKPTETLIRLPDSCPCVSVLGQGKRR